MVLRRTAIPYKDALAWVIDNDDTEWLDENDPISVTACLVADIYGRTEEEVRADLLRTKRTRTA